MKIEEFINQRKKYRDGQLSIIFYSLFLITNNIQTSFDKLHDDISLKQFMLLILVEVLEGGSFTDFSKILGSSRQNVKNLALQLEKSGFVSIKENPDDKRAVVIEETKKSKEHFNNMDALYTSKMREIFKGLSDEEVEELCNFTFKILKELNGGGYD